MAAHRARVACTELAASSTGALEDETLFHGATSYLSMLHDSERNDAYNIGLQAIASKAADSPLVLDLGAGTGLLAMLALSALPRSRAVACEVYGPCARLASHLAQVNCLADRVTVVNKLASDLELGVDLSERADVCVFELFDSQLLGESILHILRDAHLRLLKPNALMVPRCVQLRAMLVETCPALAGADLTELRGAAWPIMVGQLNNSVIRPLSAPWDAAAIDFSALPPSPAHAMVTKVEVAAAGIVRGVVWWWDLDMGGGHLLTNWSPTRQADEPVPARHHWRPCISFMAPRDVKQGVQVEIAAVHDDDAVWFAWHEHGVDIPPRWIDGITAIPPERERLIMARSTCWTQPLTEAAAAIASLVKGEAAVLLLPAEDCLMLATMAEAVLAAGKSASVRLPPRRVRRLKETGLWDDRIRLITDAEVGTCGASFAEPFAPGDMSPWLLALNCRTRLAGAASFLTSGSPRFPSSAVLVAMAIECKSAWLARQRLTTICRLDMSAANKHLLPSQTAPLDCPLCELAWQPLSHPAEILKLDMCMEGPWHGKCELTTCMRGTCHGVALWVDFLLPGRGKLSTGPPSPGCAPTGWSQALQLLDEPISMVPEGVEAMCVEVEVSLDGEAQILLCRSESAKRRRTQSD